MIDQKGHTWILKTLAKHNAKITVLETYFLRNGQIELSFFTDKAGIVRQKIPKETASKSLSELLSEIKKEYKTAQKIRNTGKFACSIVGRNTKLKLDLAGLKEFRHKVQSFPLMHYVQKTKPCNRNEESWYVLNLSYVNKSYQSQFLWKDSDREIPSNQRLLFEMAKSTATTIISTIETEESKRVVKLTLNLFLDETGVLWLMSCESSMLPDDELATFKINCVEDLLALESRPRTTRNKTQLTFTGQKNLDFDKPRILRNFSPIRIRSPNNSNGAVSPIHQADKEISPQNYNFSRLLTVNITKVSSSSHLDLKNSGGSSPHGKLNRSRTTITSPFTFHSFAPKIVKEPDLSKISNPSLSEENTSSSRDSLSDGSINVHFLEILGREKCRSRSKVTNPLRDSTPNLEELKTEMRNIRERIRNFEEEVVHKRHQMRRNSKIPPRRNSFVQSKKNKSDDKMKQPKIKLNFQANYKSDDDNKAYLSPFSSLDSPFKKAAQQAAKSLAKPKSYTTNHSRNESEANPRTPISNISKQMNINRLNSPKSELVSPKFPLTEPAKSIKTVVRKKLNIGYRPVQTSHSRFRILKNARSPKSK